MTFYALDLIKGPFGIICSKCLEQIEAVASLFCEVFFWMLFAYSLYRCFFARSLNFEHDVVFGGNLADLEKTAC